LCQKLSEVLVFIPRQLAESLICLYQVKTGIRRRLGQGLGTGAQGCGEDFCTEDNLILVGNSKAQDGDEEETKKKKGL